MPGCIEAATAGIIARVRIRGFRSARDVTITPGQMLALVGEPGVGKSNLLAAVRLLLDPDARAVAPSDIARGWRGEVAVEARLTDGREVSAVATPSRLTRLGATLPPALFMPGELRTSSIVSPAATRMGPFTQLAGLLADIRDDSAAQPALSILSIIEHCCDARMTGTVLLVEEPELYLRPQGQRYLYRLLRRFSSLGNQVLYSTHSPSFLNVARLEELAIVGLEARSGTQVNHPEPLAESDVFRVVSEFDAERSELFLARSAILVEGRTEKLVLPFVFRALGHDPDREWISIIECGGKSNIPVVARVCIAAGIPFVVMHDRDAAPGHEPIPAEQALNQLIARVAGSARTLVLEPDFEAVAGIAGHKPEAAWRWFSSLPASGVPPQLATAVGAAIDLAQR